MDDFFDFDDADDPFDFDISEGLTLAFANGLLDGSEQCTCWCGCNRMLLRIAAAREPGPTWRQVCKCSVSRAGVLPSSSSWNHLSQIVVGNGSGSSLVRINYREVV